MLLVFRCYSDYSKNSDLVRPAKRVNRGWSLKDVDTFLGGGMYQYFLVFGYPCLDYNIIDRT